MQPGEVVGFVGPNGAGKTTTLKLLFGLLYPTSGEALVLSKLLFGGDLLALLERFAAHKTIVIQLQHDLGSEICLGQFGEVISVVEGRVTLRVAKSSTAEVAARLVAALPVVDLSIVDPTVEDVIEQVFTRGVADAPAGIAHDC